MLTRKHRVALGAAVAYAAFAFGTNLTIAQDGHDHKHAAAGEEVTIEGELIDTACFVASDGDAKGAGHAECAQKCMATGIPAGILPKGKDASGIMFLLTNPKPFAPHAAKTIRVVGTPHTSTHAFDVKKAYVIDGGHATEITLDDEHHKMGGGGDAAKEGGHAEHKDGHAGHAH